MLASLLALLVSLLLVGLAATTGCALSADGWFRELSKPSWTPPNIAFPIAWGILYLLMAIVAWRIYMADDSVWRSASLAAYALQLMVNAAWSWLFFGRKQTVVG